MPEEVTQPVTREDRLQSILSRYGADATYVWDVYRLDPQNRRGKMISQIHGVEFDEFDFGMAAGPGDYERGLRVLGAGVKTQLMNERFSIDDRIREVAAARTKASQPTAQQVDTGQQVAALLETLTARLGDLERRIQAQNTVAPPPPPANDGPSWRDMLDMMNRQMDRLAQASPGRSDITLRDIIPLIQQRSTAGELGELMKLAKDMRDQGGGGDADSAGFGALVSVIDKIIPEKNAPLQSLHAAPTLPAPAPAAPEPQPAAGIPAKPAASPPTAKRQPFPGAASITAGLRKILPMLRGQKPTDEQLAQAASAVDVEIQDAGGDPSDVASRYEADSMTDAIVGYAPDLEAHRAAIVMLAARWLSEFESDEEPVQEAPA